MRNTAFYTLVVGAAGDGPGARLRARAGPGDPGHRLPSGRMYFLPLVTSSVAVGLVWLWIYAPQGGLLNALTGDPRHPAPALDQRPVLGDARDHR